MSRNTAAPAVSARLSSVAGAMVLLAASGVAPALEHEVRREGFAVHSEDGLELFVRRISVPGAARDLEPLLLVNGGRPGVFASWAVDVPQPSKAAMFAAGGHTVYLMDARGFGRSAHAKEMQDGMEDGPVAVRSFEAVRDIRAVVAEIGRRHPHDRRLAALGWATGSQWLGHFASLHPDAFTRLILRSQEDFWSRESDVQTLAAHRDSAASAAVQTLDGSHDAHLLPASRQRFVDVVLRFTSGDTAQASAALEPPGTFAGTLPCADCPGIRTTLTLFDDATFRRRQVYLDAGPERDAAFFDLGRWRVDAQGRLRLDGGTEGPGYWEILEPGRIRMLDTSGRPIRSSLDYTLERLPAVDRVAGPMRLSGRYRYFADAASFEECLTGRSYPVLIEGRHIEVERAYLELGLQGDPVFAILEAEFVERPPEPGLPAREHLSITGFDRFMPGKECAVREGAAAAVPLLDTRWELQALGGEPIEAAARGEPPWLVLGGEKGNSVSGHGGCNRIRGSFDEGSDGFRFGPLATTRMACPPPQMTLERELLSALEAAEARRLSGDTLQFLAGGRVLAAFKAASGS